MSPFAVLTCYMSELVQDKEMFNNKYEDIYYYISKLIFFIN